MNEHRMHLTSTIAALLLLATVLLPVGTEAATIVVDTAADVIVEDGACGLREAIINANNGDQSGSTDCTAGTPAAVGEHDSIEFDPALDGTPIMLETDGAGEDAGLTGDLDVTDNLVIQGNGRTETIIDGDGIDRLFELHDTEPALTVVGLQLNDLTVRNGEATSIGGGIRINGSSASLIMERCAVTGNTATGITSTALGGGIFSEGTVVLEDVDLVDNQAVASGGILAAGGGMVLSNDFLGRRLTVSGNAAESESSAFGGGAFAGDSGSIFHLVDSSVTDNTAISTAGGAALGGGLVLRDIYDLIVIDGPGNAVANSEISGNRAVSDGGGATGGGIYLEAPGLIYFFATTVSSNVAGGKETENSFGGGLANFDVDLQMFDVTITGNTANAVSDARGGGVYSDSAGTVVANSIIAGNQAPEDTGTGPDCNGPLGSVAFTLLGTNAGCPDYVLGPNDLIGIDPLLGPLENNGGHTRTHAIGPDSPALDSGLNTGPSPIGCLEFDQRGFRRPFDGNGDGEAECDRGAYEYRPDRLFENRFE